jgi:hypothetical protein
MREASGKNETPFGESSQNKIPYKTLAKKNILEAVISFISREPYPILLLLFMHNLLKQ